MLLRRLCLLSLFLSGGSGSGRTRSSCCSACRSGLVGLCRRRLRSGVRFGLLRLRRIRLLLCLGLLGSSRRLLLSWGRSAHLLRFASQSATDIGGLNLRAALGYLLGVVLRRRLLCLRLWLLLFRLLRGQVALRGCALLRFRPDYLVSFVGSLVLRRPSFLLRRIRCSLWRSYLRLGGSGALLWRWSARGRGRWSSLLLCSAGSTR